MMTERSLDLRKYKPESLIAEEIIGFFNVFNPSAILWP
jgi:hypothetical protein